MQGGLREVARRKQLKAARLSPDSLDMWAWWQFPRVSAWLFALLLGLPEGLALADQPLWPCKERKICQFHRWGTERVSTHLPYLQSKDLN